MAEKPTPFVVNDRRKFTSDGELRHDTDSASPESPKQELTLDNNAAEQPVRPAADTIPFPSAPSPVAAASDSQNIEPREPLPFPGADPDADPVLDEEQLPPAPTSEQSDQAARAYAATVDRLDTAIRASNPGAERIPEMSFDRFVQSLYMQAILQLGGGAEPGQQPQVDVIGARQTIDMLAILAEKTKGNLGVTEDKLLQSAVFESRMAFLEITQAIARQAAGRQSGSAGMPGGPSIVR